MTFTRAFYAILVVVLFHIVFLFTDAYFLIQGIDDPMHFAGGFVMAMLGLAVHRFEITRSHTKHVSVGYRDLFVIGFTIIIAVLWEFHEYVLDNTLAIWLDWPRSQVSLQDTMSDLLLGLLGGTMAFILFRKQSLHQG